MSSCVRAVPTAQVAVAPETTEHEITAVTDAHAAFEQLYRETADRVYGLCLRMTGDRRRAAELAQEVFVRVWRGHAPRRPGPGTAAGSARDSVWRLAVRVSLGAGRVGTQDLPSRTHAAFVLHDAEGCSDPVVAELLGVPEAEARALLASARGRMLSRRAVGAVHADAASPEARHLDDAELSDAVDGLLDERAGESLHEHLRGCVHCRARHDELRSLIASARASRSAVTVPPDLWTVVSGATVYAPMVRRYVIRSPRLAFVVGGVVLALVGAAAMALILR